MSLTTTTPSILASNWSSCDCVRVREFPSRILKVNPEGKLATAAAYVSTIFFISAEVPETINSIFFKFWKALPLIDQVELTFLSNESPVKAPTYSSQLSTILSLLPLEVVIPAMLPFAEIIAEEELVIKDLTFSEVSAIVTPEAKLSVNKF